MKTVQLKTAHTHWTLFFISFSLLLSSSYSGYALCDLIHPHFIDAGESMISKICIFFPELPSELQPHISSVDVLHLDGPSNHKLCTSIIEFILSPHQRVPLIH